MNQKNNITIGWLSTQLGDTNESFGWEGACCKCKELNIKLISFIGERYKENKIAYDANQIYEFAKTDSIDGVIIWASQIYLYLNDDEKINYISSFLPKPIISLNYSFKDENIISIVFDNEKGIESSLSHLIEIHNYKKIAFVRGPENHKGAETRFKTFNETMAKYGFKIDNNLISPPGPWDNRGESIAKLFFIERKLKPKIDIDAIICANTSLALELIESLKKMNIYIPRDIALTSFDDKLLCKNMIPTVTTVNVPFYKMGYKAVEMMYSKLNNKIIHNEIFPTELIIRESCGCIEKEIIEVKLTIGSKTESHNSIFDIKEELFRSIVNNFNEIKKSFNYLNQENLTEMFELVFDGLTNKNEFNFLNTMNIIMDRNFLNNDIFFEFQRVISIFRKNFIPFINNEVDFFSVENIFHQLRVLITKKEVSSRNYKEYLSTQLKVTLMDISNKMNTSFDFDKLINDVLTNELLKIGITSLYLCLYENSKIPLTKLVLFIMDGKKVNISSDLTNFPAKNFIPKELLPKNKNYIFFVENLYFNEEQLGYIIFESKYNNEHVLYNSFIKELSNAMKYISILKQLKEFQEYLLTKSNEIKSLILPIINSIDSTTKIIQEKIKLIDNLENIISNAYQKISDTNIINANLNEQINKSIDIINIINDISLNVKILSLNVSINAARAGSYGTVFKIIAKQIKSLSESSKKYANDISESLENLTSNIKKSITLSTENFNIMNDVKNETKNIVSFFINIKNLIEDLKLRSNEILKSMDIKKE